MSWAAPFTFALLPAVMWAVWWMFRRPRAHVRSVQFQQIKRFWADRHGLSDTRAATRRSTYGVLLALGGLGALLALARPQWGIIQEKSYDQSREVLLALDLSRSMLADDVSPTRLARAKLLIDSLLDQLRGERVGLLVFAGTSFVQSPLSADYEVLREFLAELNPSYLPQGGTNYSAMLQTALKSFGQTGDGDRFLVVLSDGEAHGEKWQPLIPQLRERGIRVIGLGVGTAAGGLVPDDAGGLVKDETGAAVLSRLEPRTLQELATQTGGAYTDAASWVDIAALVNATVEQGKKGRYVEQQAVRLRDQYQWFLAPAVLLFFVSYWIEFPVFPLTRAMQARKRRSQAAPAAIAAAVLLCMAVAGGRRALGATTQPTEPNVLETLVGDLAVKPDLAAADYARLAQTTIDVASQPGAVNGSGLTGVVDDALHGVERGEVLDRQAADWPALRQALEQLKQPKEQPPQQPPQSDQQQQQKPCDNPQPGEGQEGKSGGNASERDQQPQQSGESQPRQPDESQSEQDTSGNDGGASAQGGAKKPDDQPKDGSQSQKAGAAPENNGAQPESDQAESDRATQGESGQGQDESDRQPQAAGGAQPADPPDNSGASDVSAKQESAGQPDKEPTALHGENVGIGEIEPPQPAAGKETENTNPSGTRLVGGGNTQPAADPADPILAQALGEMDRIKNGDSPAVLFDRMNRADGARPTEKNAKNW